MPHPTTMPMDSSGAQQQPTDEASDLYYIDTKGDRFNRIYGTLHRYSIPNYHRIGRGSVLGLPPRYKIDRESALENALVIRDESGRSDKSRKRAKNILSGLSKQKVRLHRIRPESSLNTTVDFSTDYFPLSVSGKEKRLDLLGLNSDDEKHAYRSIHGKAKPDEDLPSDVEAVSDTDSEEGIRGDPDEEIKQRNAELLRLVNQRPGDVGAWLTMIDHQESLLLGSERESSSLTYAEKKSLADIKVSLYEKALKKVGQSSDRDRLLLGLLEEGAKLWDTKKLSARWQAILKSDSQFISLWVRYLDFRQTQFLDFTYERCLATFLECLKLNKSASDTPEMVQIHMYLFLRLTLFIREAGFTEHAAALWQGILELTFFRPDSPEASGSPPEIISAFLDFWESEVARIGEVGAKGWKNGGNVLPSPSSTEKPSFQLDPRSLFASWTPHESERITNARLPARSTDDSEEDDPYRVIIASDLDEILSLAFLGNSAQVLIDSFLYFCQLPSIASFESLGTTRRWNGDSFIRNELASSFYSTLEDWLPNVAADTEPTSTPPALFPHQNFLTTLDTLFADSGTWFSTFKTWTSATSDSRSAIDPGWVRKSLRLLVEATPGNDNLAEYVLAVEFACNPKDAKKYAKSLLKKRSSSLRLYNAYALMERRSGNHAAADHVWVTSLSMSKTFSARARVDSVIVWQTWVWELLEARNIAHASHLLTSIPQSSVDLQAFPDAPSFSPSSLLKVQNHLSDSQESAIASKNANAFVASTDCLAILAYLTNSQDLTKALEAYITATTRLSYIPDQSNPFIPFATELLHQSRARLLYHHIRTSTTYKPTQIRTLLSESISLFRHNTIFLSLFAWTESRFRIDERVRDTIRDITSMSSSTPNNNTTLYPTTQISIPITTHLFSIYTELLRPVYAGSTLHSVRAAFERAIGSHHHPSSVSSSSSSTAPSSITLWKLYILFELSRRQIQRAKDVFYRGMRACPWSKDLLMLAFTHLRADVVEERYSRDRDGRKGEGMAFGELRHVYNVLVEKELRVLVDVEGLLDEVAVGVEVERRGVGGLPINMPEDGDSDGDVLRYIGSASITVHIRMIGVECPDNLTI
ncbi:DUF1740-domain-containing protein [Aspergillus heteromorphus CBS 117.55]|uniref:DUF1740-domain-containing protein n=1 Tax=Aspergillus heteromorphus CBS 117.55 TaxID=1448321 RepID=A0A317WVP7_9EURO|nr:DUF1740-domain-containing protein [Aspergillus heteromorphus CBS 117.55]PWY88350.1 DUF1740-domain-containing protein [Aspergillus heteromorphus CBS 117.55]